MQYIIQYITLLYITYTNIYVYINIQILIYLRKYKLAILYLRGIKSLISYFHQNLCKSSEVEKGNKGRKWVDHGILWIKEGIVVVQSLSHVCLFETPWTIARQAPLSATLSRSLLISCPLSGDAIQPSHPLLPSSPFVLSLSQHQGLFY